MAVFSKPTNRTIVLSEKSAKQVLSTPVNKQRIERIRRDAEKIRKNNIKKV